MEQPFIRVHLPFANRTFSVENIKLCPFPTLVFFQGVMEKNQGWEGFLIRPRRLQLIAHKLFFMTKLRAKKRLCARFGEATFAANTPHSIPFMPFPTLTPSTAQRGPFPSPILYETQMAIMSYVTPACAVLLLRPSRPAQFPFWGARQISVHSGCAAEAAARGKRSCREKQKRAAVRKQSFATLKSLP